MGPLLEPKSKKTPSEEELARWEATTLKKTLEKSPERQKQFLTTSSMPIERLYTAAHLKDWDVATDLGSPGEFPFTRGVHPTMYRGKLWTMRQFAGFATPEETNQRYHYLLKHGQAGLSVAYDMPTLYGYDADSSESLGEVGVCGVNVSSLKDMEILFKGIPLDKITTSMTINGPAAVVWAMYLANAEKQGVSYDKLGGTTQNDILKEYIAQKEFLFPPLPSMRLVTDTVEFGSKHVPRWNTISISGYHIREAGSTAVQELAFTLADGMEYVRWGIERGLKVDEFAPRLSFFFNSHNDIFEEISKFRAARRLWAKIMKERFHAQDPRSWMLRTHAQTAGSTLTAQQPDNNVIRVTLQALAAVLGGTNSLHTNSKDEALALPTEAAVRVALRTQQVIAYESGAADTIDPLAGSYFVESLTDALETKAVEYIERIDTLGGAVKAIEAGYQQREIHDAAFRYQQAIENKDQIIVGVNDFLAAEETPHDLLKINLALENRQKAKVAAVRAERSQAAAKAALDTVESTARADGNLMPAIIDAVRAYATLGEISDAMRRVFGEYRPPSVL